MKGLIDQWGIDGNWTLFLDRDGTINKRIDGYIKTWEEFSFLSRAPQAIAKFSKIFGKIIIVTNQQGIDKEIMTHEDLQEIHSSMLQVIDFFGGRIDAIYYEPSLAQYDAFGRKPNPGMAHFAKKDFPQIDFTKSLMVGDTINDIEFGKSVGMKTVWIENVWERNNKKQIMQLADVSVTSLSNLFEKF